MSKSSIHFRPVKQTSEAHNLRQVELDYNYPDLQKDNQSFVDESIEDRMKEIKKHCKQVSGRKLQKNAQPVKEAVVNLKPDTSMEDLKELSSRIKKKFGVECFQIHIHRDEGHKNEKGDLIVNHHAHMLFDWQNKKSGKTQKMNRYHLSQIQTLVADTLQMERGELRVNSNRKRLEPIEYKRKQEQKRLKTIEYKIEEQCTISQSLQEQNEVLEQKKNKVRERIKRLEEDRAADDQGEVSEDTETALKSIFYSSWENDEAVEEKLTQFDEKSLNQAIQGIEAEIRELEASLKSNG